MPGDMPHRLRGVPLRQFPKDKIMTSALTPLGSASGLCWGQLSKVVSAAFEDL